MNVKIRQMMERAIATKLLTTAIEKGLKVCVDDGDGYSIVNSTDVDACLKEIFAVDDCVISFDVADRDGTDDGDCIFWVQFVMGNDGYDSVSDYSIPSDPTDKAMVEEIMKGVDSLSKKLGEGEIDVLFGYAELVRKILAARAIREASYSTIANAHGAYTKTHEQAASEVSEDLLEAALIAWLNSMVWNDIQIWAHHVQGKDYVGEYGRATPDGKFFLPDGTEYTG